MKKLIVIKPNGNHSNRLLQNLHFEVFCKEHNIDYYNPSFNNMAHLYNAPCNSNTSWYYKFLQIDLLGDLFHHSSFVKKAFSMVWLISKLGCLKLVRFDKSKKIAEGEKKLLKAFRKNDQVYVAGWWFRAAELTKKYQPEISYNYSLKSEYYKDNTLVTAIKNFKEEGHTLIGIHIRRGDYIKWKGGKYYYDDATYQKFMNSLSQQLSNKGIQKQKFIVFSNEKPTFPASDDILISTENWYIDQYIMSLCDYLIGPPSTFTKWASYIGKVKLYHISDKNHQLKLEDFKQV